MPARSDLPGEILRDLQLTRNLSSFTIYSRLAKLSNRRNFATHNRGAEFLGISSGDVWEVMAHVYPGSDGRHEHRHQ
jgi:hypothetical protein